MPNAVKTAFCLGGGGSYGIFQFGQIKRALEVGVKPDIVLGTSVGSLNGVGLVQGDIELMEHVWLNVQNKDIRALAPWRLLTGSASLYNYDPMRKSLQRFVKPDLLIKSPIEFYVTTTSLRDSVAMCYRLSGPGCHPNPVDILHASCSPPILVPPVNAAFYDGGLSDNYNVGFAISKKAQHIVMMHPNRPRRWQIKNIVDAVEAAIAIPMWNNYLREIEGLRCLPDDVRPKLTVIEPATPPAHFGMFDFSFGKDDRKALIKIGYDLAAKILK